MKAIKHLKILLLFTGILLSGNISAQEAKNKVQFLYTYTFEGMENADEAKVLDQEISKLNGVISSQTIFKSAEHIYTQLRVEVRKTRSESEKVATPEDLKAIIIKHKYTPGEFKRIEPTTK